MQSVQRRGATQERTTKKKIRTDLNEIKEHQKTSQVTIVKADLFGTSSSMGHCVSSDFFMRAGIAKRFNRLHPQMKDQASTTRTPGSVFAYYDLYSRRWIYNLVTKEKYFHKPFYNSLKNSLILMRNRRGSSREKLSLTGTWMRPRHTPTINIAQNPTRGIQQAKVSVTVCIRHY